MNSGYALHPQAFADLDDIRGYIAQNSPDAADRVILEIFETLRGLVPFPHQGHRRPDLSSRPLRFILVREYLIAYAPEEKLGCRGDARTPQPPHHGRDPERQGVNTARTSAV